MEHRNLLGEFGGPGLKGTLRTMHEFIGLPTPLGLRGSGHRIVWRPGAHRGIVEPCRFLSWFGDQKGHGYVIIVRGSGAMSLDRLLYISFA
jgi:hypothetical protein